MLALPAFIVVISVIIVFHELGHYWVARLFKTKIDAFSIGFGPRLFGWIDKVGTEWKICLLPIGGYVKFHGDASAASVPDREKLDELKRAMAAEGTDPHSILHFKPLYQRALVVFAGPFANFVLALVLLTGFLSLVGEPYQPIIVNRVMPDSPAQAAGIKAGDQIVAANGWKLFTNNDLVMHVSLAANTPLTLDILRDGHKMDLTVKPASRMITLDNMGRSEKMRGGRIGIEMKMPTEASLITYHHGPFSAAKRGVDIISTLVRSTFWYLGDLVTGQAAPNMLGGPLRIAQMSGEVAQTGVVNLIAYIALISVSVGMVNLFPIPILDGGHLLFYAIEAIQGRPLSHRVQEIGFRIGLAVLALIFIFVTWNDILYLLPGRHPGAP
jgi:regulator of sigma E protease